AGRPGQGRPAGCGRVAGRRARPPGLGLPVGSRAPRVARRVRGHGPVGVRAGHGRPRRRRRTAVPASRLPRRDGRGVHRPSTRRRPSVRAWSHAGVGTTDGAKMATSAGILVLLDALLAVHPAGAVRLMILDRPWAQGWDYRPALLDAAAIRLESLYRAAARNVPDEPAAVDGLRRLLATDLNGPAALDLAAEAGGATARPLAGVLGLA